MKLWTISSDHRIQPDVGAKIGDKLHAEALNKHPLRRVALVYTSKYIALEIASQARSNASSNSASSSAASCATTITAHTSSARLPFWRSCRYSVEEQEVRRNRSPPEVENAFEDFGNIECARLHERPRIAACSRLDPRGSSDYPVARRTS